MTTAVARTDDSTIAAFSPDSQMFVTMRVDSQLFGIPVLYVRDVLKEQRVAPIPLASGEIAGSINLRGRIVTVINLRKRLKLAPRAENTPHMFVVVENRGEFYSLMVDSVGEVLTVPAQQIEKTPANMESNWREVSSGICRLQGELLVIINTQSMLSFAEA